MKIELEPDRRSALMIALALSRFAASCEYDVGDVYRSLLRDIARVARGCPDISGQIDDHALLSREMTQREQAQLEGVTERTIRRRQRAQLEREEH